MARDVEKEEMRETILLLEQELSRLQTPPYKAGTILQIGSKTIQVITDNGGFVETGLPNEDGLNRDLRKRLKQGSKVILNEACAIVGYSEFNDHLGGEITTVDEINGNRLRVQINGEPRMVLSNLSGIKVGDEVQLDRSGLLATERFSSKKTRYNLERIPEAPWSNIGGLEATIGQIQSEVEEPFLHRAIFERYG